MEEKSIFENLEAQTYDKCPNCDSPDTFLLPQRICTECGYSLEHNNIKKNIEDKSKELVDNFNNKAINKKLNINNWILSSYEIIINEWKIEYIKFKLKKKQKEHKFIVNIKYQLIEKEKKYIDISETRREDREQVISTKTIENLSIKSIAEKAKSWYKEKKKSPNYFTYLWLDYYKTIKLIEKVLKHFHQIW